jgi:protein TonB
MIATRYAASLAMAALVTFGLFWVMQALISVEGTLDESIAGRMVEFVRLKRESEADLKKRRLPDKRKPDETPPPPPLDFSKAARPGQDVGSAIAIAAPELEISGGPNLGAPPSDADIIPLVRVNPQYPSRAVSRGIEGWVTLEFTITAAGTVVDPVVIESSSSLFHSASLRAIKKWKYNPKIVDGKPVERPGVRVRLDFELDE